MYASRSSRKKLLKFQLDSSWVIMSLILVTSLFILLNVDITDKESLMLITARNLIWPLYMTNTKNCSLSFFLFFFFGSL